MSEQALLPSLDANIVERFRSDFEKGTALCDEEDHAVILAALEAALSLPRASMDVERAHGIIADELGREGATFSAIRKAAEKLLAALQPSAGWDDAFNAGVEAAAKAIDQHRPDASFDDSQAGAMERTALLDNIAAEVRALSRQPEGDGG